MPTSIGLARRRPLFHSQPAAAAAAAHLPTSRTPPGPGVVSPSRPVRGLRRQFKPAMMRDTTVYPINRSAAAAL
ncbi:unnamed protein product [Heligmosomoides polygyrus]|uniref:Uncharacterized protein n=1 Tax=Heligmosomoides polygyrus TaxID=6339 RepID=A0A183FMQ0_HELPZ|nr:unnamed protein product [Heligmosomoides polygyrus]